MVRDQDRNDDRRSIETVLDEIEGSANPLRTREDPDLLIERIGDANFVLLWEASHGTSDYYQWRAPLSSRRIAEKGFDFVAVEGNWPNCYRRNRYVERYPEAGANARDVRYAFNRWPTWMWAIGKLRPLPNGCTGTTFHVAEAVLDWMLVKGVRCHVP